MPLALIFLSDCALPRFWRFGLPLSRLLVYLSRLLSVDKSIAAIRFWQTDRSIALLKMPHIHGGCSASGVVLAITSGEFYCTLIFRRSRWVCGVLLRGGDSTLCGHSLLPFVRGIHGCCYVYVRAAGMFFSSLSRPCANSRMMLSFKLTFVLGD